jgi:hypothetical protein
VIEFKSPIIFLKFYRCGLADDTSSSLLREKVFKELRVFHRPKHRRKQSYRSYLWRSSNEIVDRSLSKSTNSWDV